MKITSVEPLLCDGGFRPWTFVKVTTDEGIVGYGDCTDWGSAIPVAACVRDLAPLIVGQDPANVERIWWQLYNKTIRSIGGIAHKAMAGIDSALWDIKGKRLGVPGLRPARREDARQPPPLLDALRHDAQHLRRRARRAAGQVLRRPRAARRGGPRARLHGGQDEHLQARASPAARGRSPAARSRPSSFATPAPSSARSASTAGRTWASRIDVGFSFNMGAATRLARALEPYDMMWLETETLDPLALQEIRRATRTPICTGESLYQTHGYKPYLEAHAVDVIMPDFAWNGITMGGRSPTSPTPTTCRSRRTTATAR